MSAPDQVYVVTAGEYSDYSIHSIWLSLEEATRVADQWAQVEVWPIGDRRRTLGNFTCSAQIDMVTGAVTHERFEDDACFGTDERADVCYWPNGGFMGDTYGIRISQPTRERADKVYSEVKARVLADISTGLPPELIADTKYTGGTPAWVPTERVHGKVGQ